MLIGLLGPFEVVDDDGARVAVPGARMRTLVAALALESGRVVPRTRLVDWVWGEEPPADEANALQVLVSRLRRLLPPGTIEAASGGYRLAVAPEAVDVGRFEDLVARARDAEDASRASLLREALELWRGEPLADVAPLGGKAFDAVVTGLAERRLAVLGDRIDAEVRLGRGADLVTELTDLVSRHPLREGFVAALMRSLAEAGRGTEAMTAYQGLSRRLAEELGVDPSAEVSALHTAILRGELGGRSRNRHTNLRSGLTDFVGRDADVAAVTRLSGRHRLVTLTGPGGSGKTRLAVETANPMLAELPDGAWLVELAPLRDGADLAQAVLTAIGLRDQAAGGAAGAEPVDRLVAALRDRVLLLVLDNCEHMIDAASAFAERLLGECRGLRILATSREPLGITGEALWQVEPLGLPEPEADPAAITAAPAVVLLRDRAEAVRRDIGADAATLATMARICRALDGMPLAIELAAARLRTMSVDQLADRLDDRFRLLTGGSRTGTAHHRTLTAVVEWSWDLLNDDERELLRRLSVFTGGVSLEAVERVCPEGEDPLDLLTSVTEKSLLQSHGTGEPRYRMLNTIREYALRRLADSDGEAAARRAHLEFVTELAADADPRLRGPRQLEWLARLETEHDNIGAALRWAIAEGLAAEAQRLVGAAGWYWYLSGHRAEGTELGLAALALPGEVDDEDRAVALTVVTMFVTSGYGGDQFQAAELIREGHELALRSGYRHQLLGFLRPLERMLSEPGNFLPAFDPLIGDPDPWVRAQARLARGRLRLSLGSDETGVDDDIAAALAEFRVLDDRWGISSALMFLAERLAARGEFTDAIERYRQSAAALADVGSAEELVGIHSRLAQLYWLSGENASSVDELARAERLATGITWPDTLCELTLAKATLSRWRGEPDRARTELAALRHRDGGEPSAVHAAEADLRGYLSDDLDESRAHRAEAYRVAERLGYRPFLAQALIGLAELSLRRGRAETAVRLLAAADTVRGTPDRSLPDAARLTAEAREQLGDQGFDAIVIDGPEDWRALAQAALAD